MAKQNNSISIDNLIQVDDQRPGWQRRKKKDQFVYLDENGKILKRQQDLERIEQLVIPPIWSEVWICKLENGHLQSTGRDLRRRKQYIYHPDWIAYRQAMKFKKILDFAYQLPLIRQTTALHLKDRQWTKRKVLALIVQVLDECHIRIGNKYYKEKNNTFGLTTLRRKHLELTDDKTVRFEYKAKSNKYRKVSMDSKKLAKLVKKCSELRGYEVFRYQDGADTHPIDSSDVNQYIQEIAGDKFTAKDFRTWAGTALAVEHYPIAQQIVAEEPRKKLEPTVVKLTAKELGNTMAICRDYYIHPAVLAAVEAEAIPAIDSVSTDELKRFEGQLSAAEVIAIRLMERGMS